MKNCLRVLPRCFLLMLALGSFQSPALGQVYAHALPVSVQPDKSAPRLEQGNENKRSVRAILFALEEAYHVSFNYDDAMVRNLNLKEDFSWKKNESLEIILKRLVEKASLKFEKAGADSYLIFSNAKKENTQHQDGARASSTLSPESFNSPTEVYPVAQEDRRVVSNLDFQVSGIVKDETDTPIPGVNVILKGTATGTTTDSDGKYVLSVPDDGGTLVFSFIGFKVQEVIVTNQTQVDVSLEPDTQTLDEVVIVGYGEQKRSNVVGSVATVSSKELEDIPASSLSTLLEGRMAGVHIDQATGRPGAATKLTIRTQSSWSLEPVLYVIDGFIRDQAAFDVLDPTEIESVSVLKDAAAAVYGARAAGGVVLVKTKRGKEGKAKISYSGSYGVSEATQFTDMLSAYDHAVFVNDRVKILQPTTYADDPQWYTEDELEHFKTLDHNWLNEAWKSSSTSRHTINISGGSESVRYFGGASFYKEKGNLPGTELKKYTLRIGLDADITKDLSASITLSGDNRLDEQPFNTEDNEDPMSGTFKALFMAPRWLPPYINGLPVGHNGTVASHPLEVNRINSYKRSEGSNMVLNGALEYKVPVVEGLRFKVAYSISDRNAYSKQHRIGYNLYNFQMTGGHNHIFTDVVNGNPVRIKNDERLQEKYDNAKSYQLNGNIMYDRAIGLHNIGVLLVYEQAESEGHDFTAQREGNIVENYERQEGFSEAQDGTSSGASAFARLSYIGRLNYSYAERYLLEAAFRYEGSVKFMPAERWGFFPSVSAGWRISEETFFKDNITFINNLKLRASAGLVGNDNVGSRQWELSYGIATGAYLGGSGITNALNPRNSGVVATAATWEKSRSYNTGIEMGFVNGISMTFDYFNRYTYDILDSRNSTLPTSTGIDKMPPENFGRMRSWGFDASVNYDGQVGDNFGYTLGVNMSWARSKVLEKFQSIGVAGTWEDEIGKMPGGEVGFIAKGIIRTQEQLDAILEANPDYTIGGKEPALGMMDYEDVGGPNRSDVPDGIIDDNDRRIIAPAVSALGFNFNLGASWKGIRINTIIGLDGFGTKVFYDKEAMTPPTEKLNGPAFWNDHWTAENPDAAYPRAVNYGLDGQRSTFWMKDGLSMSWRVLNASYDLPKALLERWRVPQVRIYFSARNLLNIINPYEYKDPSIARFNSYPTLRTYNFGVNIGL